MARTRLRGLAIAIAFSWFATPALAAQDPPGGKPRATQPAKQPAKSRAPVKPTQVKKADDTPVDTTAEPAPDAEANPDAAPSESAPAESKAPCPPGAFCEDQEVAPPAEAEAPDKATTDTDPNGTKVTLPPPRQGADPKKPRTFTYVPDPDGGPGQVIVYEDGAEPPRAAGERVEEIPPPKHRWHRHRR